MRRAGSSSSDADARAPGTARRAAVAVAAGLVALSALGVFVVATDAGLAFDDAGYLTRGHYHAAQVTERGFPVFLRLPWSLRFESPKPPLFHGWIALCWLLLPDRWIGAILLVATLVPLALLGTLVAKLAATAGGFRAGAFALVALAATPLALEVGTRLLVEVTLAACVCGATWMALERCRRPGDGRVALGLGLFVGAAALAKLLAPLFLLPMLAVVARDVVRREGVARAARWAFGVLVVAAAVAGLWYQRNLAAALQFAHEARQHAPSLYLDPWWTRPAHLFSFATGWALPLGWLALAGAALARRAAAPPELVRLRCIAAAVALASAPVVASQPVFDPRYWLPALALLAAWAGAEASDAFGGGLAWRRRAMVLAAALLVALSAARLLRTDRPRMAWSASRVVGELGASGAARFCELGDSPEWNVEKLRLAVELSGLRPRPTVAEPLWTAAASGIADRLAACDVVFALAPEELTPAEREGRLNSGLVEAYARLNAPGSGFVLARESVARLGSRAPVAIFRKQSRDG